MNSSRGARRSRDRPLKKDEESLMASADPITEFLNAVERARAHQVDTAPVILATTDAEGQPSARLVLLRGIDQRGFVFFTNYNSRKGASWTPIRERPCAFTGQHSTNRFGSRGA
jgi:pyridoxamine 5'-phosphate oxidase